MGIWSGDYCPDPFDDTEDADDDDISGYRARTNITCKHCGRSGLKWSEISIGVFRLFDPKLGQLHHCPKPDHALDFK